MTDMSERPHAPSATFAHILNHGFCPDTAGVTGSNPVSPTSNIPRQRLIQLQQQARRAGYVQDRTGAVLVGNRSNTGSRRCSNCSLGGARGGFVAPGAAVAARCADSCTVSFTHCAFLILWRVTRPTPLNIGNGPPPSPPVASSVTASR